VGTTVWARWRARGGLRGEGDPSPVARAGDPPAVLALHGFGGTPREVDLVVEVAQARGLRVVAPLLPGHGTTVNDLAQARFRDWLGAARDALFPLTDGGSPAVVVGLSLGAVLAARLAAGEPERVAGVGLLANALWLPPLVTAALDRVRRSPVADFWVPKLGSDIAEPTARANHLSYGAQPLGAAADLLRGARETRPLLGRIQAPTLIVHGLRDRVCPAANAWRAAALLAAVSPSVLLLPRSHHIVTRDLEHERVRAAVNDLLQSVAP
jgi:carboxylesterase